MKVKEITQYLESLAPLSSQESYDNSGLIVGSFEDEVKEVLVSLDCTEAIVDEAIKKGCQMIISHHPIVFKGLKKFNGKNYVERVIQKAIKNDVVLYAIHTNLDNFRYGVNFEIGRRLKLNNIRVLSPSKSTLNKLVFYVPTDSKEKVLDAIFKAGGGEIGDYSQCSFSTVGNGTFFPNENANPVIGERNNLTELQENRVEVLVSKHNLMACLKAMINAHPYEEVAHEVLALENRNQFEGAGMIGELEKPVKVDDFLKELKLNMNTECVRYTNKCHSEIKTVAYCGGSGSFLLNEAKSQKADIFITGDFKYHEFFDAENELIIADIGHYESEQFTSSLIMDLLKKKFPTFAVRLTEENTNPINYL